MPARSSLPAERAPAKLVSAVTRRRRRLSLADHAAASQYRGTGSWARARRADPGLNNLVGRDQCLHVRAGEPSAIRWQGRDESSAHAGRR